MENLHPLKINVRENYSSENKSRRKFSSRLLYYRYVQTNLIISELLLLSLHCF